MVSSFWAAGIDAYRSTLILMIGLSLYDYTSLRYSYNITCQIHFHLYFIRSTPGLETAWRKGCSDGHSPWTPNQRRNLQALIITRRRCRMAPGYCLTRILLRCSWTLRRQILRWWYEKCILRFLHFSKSLPYVRILEWSFSFYNWYIMCGDPEQLRELRKSFSIPNVLIW